MNLTPLDIRKQDFGNGLWGYDAEEVEAFLDVVATQWEELTDERRRLKNRVEELESELEHYKKVEEALQEALEQTRRNAEEKLENAQEKAENIVQEAEMEAREIKQQARGERDRLESETTALQNRRSEVVAQLRAFLNAELEILETFGRGQEAAFDEPGGGTGEQEAPPSLDVPDAPDVNVPSSEPEAAAGTGSGGGQEGEEASDEHRGEVSEALGSAQVPSSEAETKETNVSFASPEPPSGSEEEVSPSEEAETEGGTDDIAVSSVPDDGPGPEEEKEEAPAPPPAPDLDAPAPPRSTTDTDVSTPSETEGQSASDEEETQSTKDESERRKRKQSRDESSEASAEEIEKIWSILEDME